MLKGFRNFIARGNVLDLAVGVIIGAAFGGIVDSLVKDLITPIIGMVGGTPDFSAVKVGPVGSGQLHQRRDRVPLEGRRPVLPDHRPLQPLREEARRGAPCPRRPPRCT